MYPRAPERETPYCIAAMGLCIMLIVVVSSTLLLFGGFGATCESCATFLGTILAPYSCLFGNPGTDLGLMKTYSAKVGEVEHGWYVVDAQNKVLGRLASQIAMRLRGKHKAEYTPHIDTGDFVVVVNVAKLRVTGRKPERKIYYRHTGYPGGLRQTTLGKMQAARPERVLQKAVKGMLPKGPLGYAMMRKLKVYAGATHPHSAQQPKPLDIQ